MTDTPNPEPGITPRIAARRPPQLVAHTIASSAVHSRSRGWLPGVIVTLSTEDGAGLVFLSDEEAILELVEVLLDAVDRARLDVEAALKNGQLPRD